MRRVILILTILAVAGLRSGVSQTPSPTQPDPRVEKIEQLYSEGAALYSKGDAASLREAAKFFVDAALRSHDLGDKTYAARCLIWAGMAYNRVNDSDNAIKHFTAAYDEAPD